MLSIGLLSLQLSAQNIELTILPYSVRVQNDSLYFIYRIQNNSDTIFALYNVRIVDFAEYEDEYYEYAPRLAAFIYDKKDELRLQRWVKMPPFQDPSKPIVRTYEDSISSLSYGKYIVLNSGKSVEYDRRIYIGSFELEKGTYKFQLRYFSSDYYQRLYIRAKKNDIQLKNSLLFEEEIKSNIEHFFYP